MAYDFTQLKKKISDTEEWLKKEFASIRTGQATPTLLDGVKVDSYGSKMPINQVANVGTEDARTLRISPWDSSMVKVIERTIEEADLGVSVVVDDKGLRVVFPELTAERRVQLGKLAKDKLEQARITVRGARDEAQTEIKKADLPEDDAFRAKEDMQKLIEGANKIFDELYAKKEKELTQ